MFAALLACALAAPAADPPAGRKFAVLIGVNEFQSRQLPPLAFAVNDATPLKPTRANIDAAIKEVLLAP
jgi:uncharacterized caspase-like protein